MLILMAQGVGNPCATHKCYKQEQLNNDENRENQMILEARLVETKKIPHQSQMISSISKNREFKSALKMVRSSNSEKDVSSIPLELS